MIGGVNPVDAVPQVRAQLVNVSWKATDSFLCCLSGLTPPIPQSHEWGSYATGPYGGLKRIIREASNQAMELAGLEPATSWV